MSELKREDAYQEPEGFVIDSDAKAKWALDKIREARADRDYWVKWYTDKMAEITAQTDFNTMNLERLLADYFATVPHKKTKTQESYPLPGGKLVMKRQNPEYKRDDKKAIEWLKQNGYGQFVKVKEELDWAGLKDASEAVNGRIVCGEKITEDGEIVQMVVDGIDVVDRPAKFVVEV
jgi:phage host-nuclease inhibitor protein Gam